ncbi:MAG TPA: carboxylating nicotinate-nucleotide diphosphorylase [Bryobacteraceae bacterium]|nr:carboxylating nicotinate-nucleotide diphosphorylase [Bryobacteraceae bacterium]
MTSPEILQRALEEDIGTGDVTTDLCVPADRKASGRFLVREPIIVAGVELLQHLYADVGQVANLRAIVNRAGQAGYQPAAGCQPAPQTDQVILHAHDGDLLAPGAAIAAVQGPARMLLTRERVALNFLQHLSGIATLARKYVDAVAGTGCRILDTRKTTPGLRQLEKMAVRAGGATNHRIGLFDAVLIKNNHITAAGGVRAALDATRNANVPVEIEVRTRTELDEALACGAKHLLLDNVTPTQAKEWIALIAGRATVEISGGITLDTVRAYAETGADFISAGAITHSARAVDIHFQLELR